MRIRWRTEILVEKLHEPTKSWAISLQISTRMRTRLTKPLLQKYSQLKHCHRTKKTIVTRAKTCLHPWIFKCDPIKILLNSFASDYLSSLATNTQFILIKLLKRKLWWRFWPQLRCKPESKSRKVLRGDFFSPSCLASVASLRRGFPRSIEFQPWTKSSRNQESFKRWRALIVFVEWEYLLLAST